MSRSSTAAESDLPPHPASEEILPEERSQPPRSRRSALAVAPHVAPWRINEIALGLQADYELMARRHELGGLLEAVKPRAA